MSKFQDEGQKKIEEFNLYLVFSITIYIQPQHLVFLSYIKVFLSYIKVALKSIPDYNGTERVFIDTEYQVSSLSFIINETLCILEISPTLQEHSGHA